MSIQRVWAVGKQFIIDKGPWALKHKNPVPPHNSPQKGKLKLQLPTQPIWLPMLISVNQLVIWKTTSLSPLVTATPEDEFSFRTNVPVETERDSKPKAKLQR